MFMVNETSSFRPYGERRLLVMPITPEQEEEMRRYIIVMNYHIFIIDLFWFSYYCVCFWLAY